VAHAFDGQKLTLHAIFTDEPLTVREVERRLERGATPLSAGALEQTLALSIEREGADEDAAIVAVVLLSAVASASAEEPRAMFALIVGVNQGSIPSCRRCATPTTTRRSTSISSARSARARTC